LQRRDQQFDSILKRGLDARRESGASLCPDEAVLAAYCDRSLSALQTAHWEEHFAECARCQAMLAAMARVRSAQDGAVARAPSRRWELYAALAAAVIGISVAVGLMRRNGSSLEHAQYAAQNMAGPSPLRGEAQSKAPEANSQIALNELSNRKAAEIGQPGVAQAPPPPGAREVAPRAKEFAKQSSLACCQPESRLGSDVSRATPQRQPPSYRESRGSAAVPAAPLPGVEAPESAPMAAAGAEAGARIAASEAPMVGFGVAQPAMVSVRTADNIERWRLGAGGSIQHLEPDGSWRRQGSGVTAALRAGAAPSPTTCWIVGTDGTILRTIDGEHWQKITSPTQSDLVAVFAVDASTASVTAADGQRYSTSDGGLTWHRG